MIPDIVPVNTWAGNDSTTTFDFDFLINSDSELKVLHTNINEYQTTLKLNIDYSITQVGNNNGSFIVFPLDGSEYSVLKTGEKITLMLDIPIAQTMPFATSAVLNLNSLEVALDYIVRLIQIVDRKTERSVKVMEGSDKTPDEFLQSLEESEANALLYSQNASDSAELSNQYAKQSQSFANVSEQQASIATSQATIATEKTNEVVQNANDAILNITNQETASLEKIQLKETEAIEAITNAGTLQLSNIELEGTEQIDAIKAQASEESSALENQFNSILSEGQTQVQAVKNEGETQLQNVKNVGFYRENDKLFYLDDNGNTIEFKTSGEKIGKVVLFDHVLTYRESEGFAQLGTYVYKEAIAGSRYGYPDFYEKYVKEYQEAVADGIYLKHENGHVFYDIANKSEVDAVYEATGIAWAYGVDTENERIFLPRNDFYPNDRAISLDDPKNLDWSNVVTVSSLPYTVTQDGWWLHYGINQNGTVAINGVNVDQYSYAANNWPGHQSVQIKVKSGDVISLVTGSAPTFKMFIPYEVVEESSGILQNKNAYMVVGNTANEEAITDIVDLTTTENDTLPLFFSQYSQQDMTTSGAFVNASLGTYLDGSYWTTAYAEIEKMGIGANFDAGTIKAYGDESITDYDLVLNSENMTFRLPLLNGTEGQFLKGTVPVAGNGVTLGLTDGTTNTGLVCGSANGALTNYIGNYNTDIGTSFTGSNLNSSKTLGVTTDETKSGLIANVDATVPEGWNLYYKLNNVVQNAQAVDLANITSALSKKVSVDNLVETPVIIETYNLGSGNGYIVYSNGWCIQWGNAIAPSTANAWGTTVTLYKTHASSSYRILLTNNGDTASPASMKFRSSTKSASTFEFLASVQSTGVLWMTMGLLAEGEY